MSLFLMPYIIPLNLSSHVSNKFLYFGLSKDKLRKVELTSLFILMFKLFFNVLGGANRFLFYHDDAMSSFHGIDT